MTRGLPRIASREGQRRLARVRAVRPHRQEGVDRLEIRGVEPADLSAMLAPVLAGVRR